MNLVLILSLTHVRAMRQGVSVLGGSKIADPVAAFKAMDQNGGGYVLFDEFSVWVARKMCVDDAADDETYADAYQGSLSA